MLKNYIKIAWRNLWKSKIFSLINIFGLSVGIAFAMLIGAYVWGELQVNHQLKDADNQYIILSKWKNPEMGFEIGSIAEMPRALRNNYPNLVANHYHSDLIGTNVSVGDRHFREDLQVGDNTLLAMYGFNLEYGNIKTALNDPFSVVITERTALKYFGHANVVGQTVNLESFSGDKHDFLITGVLLPLAQNSVTDLTPWPSDFFFNADATKYFNRSLEGWNNTGIQNYVELQPGINPKTVEIAMHSLMVKNSSETVAQNLTPYLVALKDYNLMANNGLIKKMTYTLSCIALFILLMAIVNFINICIGHSTGRMKEIGIRKVLGGLRKQLIWQFLTESILLVLLATILSTVIFLIVRPYFSNLLGKQITGLFNFPVYFIPLPFIFVLLLGLISGVYPALVLSAVRSIDSLKGRLNTVSESVLFRKTLVAFQFATATIVFIGCIVISQQISLFFSNNLGYNKEYVVCAQLPRDWSPRGVQKMEVIRQQLTQMPQVSTVSLSYGIPDGNTGGTNQIYRQGSNPSQFISSQGLTVDNQYAITYGIPLKAGIFFKPGAFNQADSSQVVINETESKALGWNNPNDALGQKILFKGSASPFIICGVTADFHFGSMQEKIPPMTISNVNYTTYYRYFSIKLKPGDMQGSVAALQKKWAELMPGAPFEYKFMDDALKKLYATEIQLQKAAYIATTLAIVIVLLGVLGLISLSIQKRTKEIGIRKVLGSSAIAVISLFLKDFLGVVLIAGVIACPLAYLIMNSWLSGYAYRIDITISPFVGSILLLIIVTAVLIVLQTMRAALANPVKSLRSE